ncbi:MAG: Uma2 family endonuclease [Acidobacteria bacterium]|nr:MAG: Uma2 family endonuclease [Acidobacteriota bacterium]
MAISTKFTHADLLVMPDDGKRREIVDGELFVTPSPLAGHQLVVSRTAAAFLLFLHDHRIGELFVAPLDVILSEYDVLEPDLLFVLNEHRNIMRDWIRGAPDLVIEVLSPSTGSRDRGPKLKAYARFGVPEYWIVDPDNRAVEVYRLAQTGYPEPRRFLEPDILASPLLPAFALAVRDIFKSL